MTFVGKFKFWNVMSLSECLNLNRFVRTKNLRMISESLNQNKKQKHLNKYSFPGPWMDIKTGLDQKICSKLGPSRCCCSLCTAMTFSAQQAWQCHSARPGSSRQPKCSGSNLNAAILQRS